MLTIIIKNIGDVYRHKVIITYQTYNVLFYFFKFLLTGINHKVNLKYHVAPIHFYYIILLKKSYVTFYTNNFNNKLHIMIMLLKVFVHLFVFVII